MYNVMYKAMKEVKVVKEFKESRFLREVLMLGFSVRERVIAWYFIFSLFLVCSIVEPVLAVCLVVVNFGNAARLVRKIEFKEIKEFNSKAV